MTWNYDISQAPKGLHETQEIEVKGKVQSRKIFEPERIIVACRDGATVTLSHWLPTQERWLNLATDEVPTAWMLWPEHPEASE